MLPAPHHSVLIRSHLRRASDWEGGQGRQPPERLTGLDSPRRAGEGHQGRPVSAFNGPDLFLQGNHPGTEVSASRGEGRCQERGVGAPVVEAGSVARHLHNLSGQRNDPMTRVGIPPIGLRHGRLLPGPPCADPYSCLPGSKLCLSPLARPYGRAPGAGKWSQAAAMCPLGYVYLPSTASAALGVITYTVAPTPRVGLRFGLGEHRRRLLGRPIGRRLQPAEDPAQPSLGAGSAITLAWVAVLRAPSAFVFQPPCSAAHRSREIPRRQRISSLSQGAQRSSRGT